MVIGDGHLLQAVTARCHFNIITGFFSVDWVVFCLLCECFNNCSLQPVSTFSSALWNYCRPPSNFDMGLDLSASGHVLNRFGKGLELCSFARQPASDLAETMCDKV